MSASFPSIRNYMIIEQIGKGTFANVYKARHLLTDTLCAIKILHQNDLNDEKDQQYVQTELQTCLKANHPLVVSTYEIVPFSPNDLAIVMELLEGGNLLDYINTAGAFSEDFARRSFFQIIAALDYLQNKLGVVHRDLKAENILFDKMNNIRIIDFGLSKELTTQQLQLSTMCGSPAYAAPELLQGQNYTPSVDIWSAGVLLYAMTHSCLPFYSENYAKLLELIFSSTPTFSPHISDCLGDLLTGLLQKDPERRITFAQIYNHPWLNGYSPTPFADSRLFLQYEEPVDRGLLAELTRLGVDYSSIQHDLADNVITDATVIYKIYKREREIFVLNQQMAVITSNLPIHEGFLSLPSIPVVKPRPRKDLPKLPQKPKQRLTCPQVPKPNLMTKPNCVQKSLTPLVFGCRGSSKVSVSRKRSNSVGRTLFDSYI